MIIPIKQYFQKNKLLFFLFLLFFLIRLPLLDHAFLLRGERDITLTGFSLAKTGRDLYGNLLPVQFMGLDMPTPMLAFYYSALWWLIIPIKSVFTARLPYVFISSFNLIFIYELVKTITKNKKLSILTAVIFCFSPGIYHLSRLALEVNLATPLLFLAMILYLRQKKFLGWIFFILAFLSYNGFRPLIPFLLVYLEFWLYVDPIGHSVPSRMTKKRDSCQTRLIPFIKNSLICLFAYLLLFAASYTFIDGQMMRSRSADLIFLNYDEINPKVDFRRNTAVGPAIFKKVLNNKITNTVYYITEVTATGISLDYLFFKGDKAAIYATTFTGQFFMISVIFYFLGFLYLGKIWKQEYFYIIGFIPIALIPSVINIDYISIAIRSILVSVSYGFIIACGLILFLDLTKNLKKIIRITIYQLLITVFIIEVIYFGYNYFYRRPVTMFESFFESEKQIAQYLIENDPGSGVSVTRSGIVLYDDSPKNILTAYYLLNKNISPKQIQQLIKNGPPYKINSLTINKCPDSGKKQQMFVKNSIIADSCVNDDQYEKLNNNGNVEKILFKDFSLRTAYFIY